jgi:hypothetical protein
MLRAIVGTFDMVYIAFLDDDVAGAALSVLKHGAVAGDIRAVELGARRRTHADIAAGGIHRSGDCAGGLLSAAVMLIESRMNPVKNRGKPE